LIPCFATVEPVALPLASDPALQRQDGPAGAIGRYYATSDPAALKGYDLSTVTSVRVRALSEAEMMAAKREPGLMPKRGAELAADSRAWAEMDEAEHEALEAFVEWERALRLAHIRRGLLALDEYDGARAVEAVESIQPDTLRITVVMEIHRHIVNISTLGPAGKALSVRGSGSRPEQVESPAGIAPTAPDGNANSGAHAADLS